MASARQSSRSSQASASTAPSQRTFVLDTSVLLSDPRAMTRFAEHEVVLPVVVVTELEAKRHHPELGYFARQALRILDELRVEHGQLDSPVPIGDGGSLRVELNHTDPESLPAGFRLGDNDTRILAVAMHLAQEGQEVTVEATVTPLGGGVLVDATATAQLKGQCVRCLRELTPTETITVSQVFSGSDDFITGDQLVAEDDGSGDDVPQIIDDTVNLEQSFVDEAGLNFPFNPVCEPACPADSDVPAPDGVSGEENDLVDPRWAGLEKFLSDGSDK